jgi:hypothetical protein
MPQMALETVAVRGSRLLGREWSPTPLIRLINKYQDRALRRRRPCPSIGQLFEPQAFVPIVMP